jgi:putative DNA primase/helicase
MTQGGGPGRGQDYTPIDFPALAASLLDRSRALVPQWLPAGTRKAKYWHVGDFDGSAGSSANVNLDTGRWIDNANPADAGMDLLSLYKRVRGFATMLQAARDLMGNDGWRAAPPAPKKQREAQWHAVRPVPEEAPGYATQWGHYARGVPHAHWEYRDRDGALLGVVCRFNASDGSKEVQPLSWAHRADGKSRMWRYLAFAQPRPLYGLWRLGPSSAPVPRSVVVVEGEKKADALYEALGRSVPVLSWPGGCKVAHLADWSVLPEGTHALLWPDADSQLDKKTQQPLPAHRQPGLAAMLKVRELLDRQGCTAAIVDTGPPGVRPDGWDAADAIADGWSRAQLEAFMATTLPEPARADGLSIPPSAARARGGDGGGAPPVVPPTPPDDGPAERWADRFILARGAVRECVANVALVLHHHAQWHGVLAFDEFAQRVVKRRPAPYDAPDLALPAEWTDVDDTRTAIWMSRTCGFVPGASMVAEAANEAAHTARFHPVLDWLRTLRHDGQARVDHWLADYFGVPDSEYVRHVARYYLVGMCARVLRPGCKFDYCLVLEGPQGRLKSSALRVLGGEWFSDTELDLSHKDSMSYIRGKWLHEFGELGSLARAEEMRQKSFLTRQVDEFRPTYGRREIRCPRQVAFAGTTNQWQWNKDPTGGRRFWPVEVGEEVDIVALASVREQLFAEAFALAQQGERYWPTADEQRALFDPEQLSREAPDAFTDLLAAWIKSAEMAMKSEFTLADACLSGLKLDARALTKDVQTRVGIALRKLECERVERRNAVPRFVYRRPTRKAASSESEVGQRVPEGEEVPF